MYFSTGVVWEFCHQFSWFTSGVVVGSLAGSLKGSLGIVMVGCGLGWASIAGGEISWVMGLGFSGAGVGAAAGGVGAGFVGVAGVLFLGGAWKAEQNEGW